MLQIKTNKIIKSALGKIKKKLQTCFQILQLIKQKCKVNEEPLLLLHSSKLLKTKHYKNPLNCSFSVLSFQNIQITKTLVFRWKLSLSELTSSRLMCSVLTIMRRNCDITMTVMTSIHIRKQEQANYRGHCFCSHRNMATGKNLKICLLIK